MIRAGRLLLLSLGSPLPASATVGEAARQPSNPWAGAGPYPMSHHDPGQTDATIVEGPTMGKQLTRSDAKTVPVVWCSTPIVKHRS